MSDLHDYRFEFNGKWVEPGAYGPGYIEEFCSVLDRFSPRTVRSVLEWGSGLTSQILLKYSLSRWNTDLFITIDDNQRYQEAIFKGKDRPLFLVCKSLDLTGPCLNQVDPELNYSTFPLSLGRKFDVIFIDGRRRMECAFIAAISFDRRNCGYHT